jgi:hypothetical protein
MITTILHLTGLWIASIFLIATKSEEGPSFRKKIFWMFRFPAGLYITIWLFITFSKLVNFLNK